MYALQLEVDFKYVDTSDDYTLSNGLLHTSNLRRREWILIFQVTGRIKRKIEGEDGED